MIEEFLIKDPINVGVSIRQINYKKIITLSDEDFAKLFLEFMTEYRDKDGFWKEGKVPRCSECSAVIDSPGNLRRYYGLSLHPVCFKKVYEKYGEEDPVMRKYWERVANLVFSLN